MTADIIDLDLRRPEKTDPHLAGKAKCTACSHNWAAVAPVGTDRLECPNCQTLRGVWLSFCTGREGVALYTCRCGCDVFVLTPDELVCTACGECKDGWYVGQDPNPPSPRRA